MTDGKYLTPILSMNVCYSNVGIQNFKNRFPYYTKI